MKNSLFDIRSLSKRRAGNKAVFSLALLAVLIYPFLLDPFRDNIVTCYFKDISGMECPTCGLSRSVYEFSRLSLAESFRFHILGPVLYTGSLLLFLKFSMEIIVKKKVKLNISPRITRAGILAAAGLWLIYWLFRILHQI